MNHTPFRPRAAFAGAALFSAVLFPAVTALSDPLPAPVFDRFEVSQGTYPDKVVLSWSEAPGSTGVGEYSIYRQSPSFMNPPDILADGSEPWTGTSFTDTTAEPGVKYEYWVRTENQEGDAAETDRLHGWAGSVPEPPAAPVMVSATGNRTDGILVVWQAGTGGGTTDTYDLWRYHYGYPNSHTKIASGLAETEYLDDDPSLVCGDRYTYLAAAFNAYGSATNQNPVEGMKLAELSGVDHFTASRGDFDDRVWLYWTPVDQTSVASYEIVRFLDQGGITGFETLTNGMTSVGYLDTAVTPDVRYRYQLRVHDKWGRTWLSDFVYGWAFSRPDNDDFKDARPISSQSGSDASTNNCATFEVSEPYPAGVATATKTVWWAYTAPFDGIVQFNTVGSSFLRHWGEEDGPDELSISTAYGVYTGQAVTVLDEVCSATPYSDDQWGYTWCSNAFEAAAGTVYHIQVSGLGNTFYDDTLQLWDEQWGRVCLNWSYTHLRVGLDPNGGTISTNAVMVPVGQKLVESLPSFPVPEREGWRFVDWRFENNASASASTNYVVTENFTLHAKWEQVERFNDDFEEAWAISGKSGSSVSTNDYATFQADESFPSGVGTEIWWSTVSTNTLWWNFTAPCDGWVQFTTDGSHDAPGGSIRTAMAVWTGDALGSLRELCRAYADRDHERSAGGCTNAFEVSAGAVYRIQAFSSQMDDGGMGKGTICLNWAYTHLRVELDPNGGTIATNAVMVPVGQKLGDALQSFPVPEREGYRLVDWKFENNASATASANFAITESHVLKAEWAWVSSNDNFEDAAPLDLFGQRSGTSAMSNTNATVQAGEPLVAAYPDATHTIWWWWRAPADGTMTVSTTSSVDKYGGEIDTVLGVYTGKELNALSEVVVGDDYVMDDIPHFWSKVEFKAKQETLYYICVGVNDKLNRQAVEGTICLNWSLEKSGGLSSGGFALLPPGASGLDIPLAIGEVADPSVEDLIGDDVDAYNDFAEWANGKGAEDVRANQHAAASYQLGTTVLLQNEPVVAIALLAVAQAHGNATTGDGVKTLRPRESGAPVTLTLDVTVSDGGEPVEVTAEKVAALVQATSDVCDWESPEKRLDPHAAALTTGSTTLVTIIATPGDGKVPQAFLRIAP